MNIIDKIVEYINPQKAYTRLAYRAAIEKRNYVAARRDRFGQWRPRDQTAELTDGPYRNLIRARARDLERNNVIVQGAIGTIVRNVIGLGIKLQATCVNARGKELDRINDKIEELWGEWSRKQYCDIMCGASFTEMQSLFLRRLIIDGDGIVIKCASNSAAFPLTLQMIESDLFAESVNIHDTNYVYGGVEVNDYMKALAYHFRLDPRTSEITRLESGRVVHAYLKTRAQQMRGVSALSGVMEPVRDIGEFVDSELKAARIAASLSGVITSEQPTTQIGRRVDQRESGGVTEIEVGTLLNLAPGDKAEFITPGRPNREAAPFVSLILRQIGMSLGLSYEALSRDLSMVNYSSAREGRLQDIKTYETLQRFIIENFCQPIYEDWLDSVVLANLITIPGYWKDRKKYQSCRWVAPGWKWVDPLKEASGIEKQLAMGLTTMQDVCGAMGTDWQEVLEQRAREEDYKRELQALYSTGGENKIVKEESTEGAPATASGAG